MESKDLLYVGEVASQLRLSKGTVYKLVHEGLIKSYRFGGAIRIPGSEMKRALSEGISRNK